MRYFTYIAEQAFKTSAAGERLFYRGGPWSRPFIIPDADTEQRLYKKQTWMLRILLGGLIVAQPLLFTLGPEVLRQSYWLLVYLVAVVLVYWGVGQIVFASDLRGLKRAPVRLGPRSFYGQMAQRHSRGLLALGFTASLLFVSAGVWMWRDARNHVIATGCIGFFGLCAVVWGYTLYLKSQAANLQNGSDEKR
jgi:hypothetical protein